MQWSWCRGIVAAVAARQSLGSWRTGFRSGLGSSRLGGSSVEVADAEAADSEAVDSEAADLAVPGTAVANWPVVKPVAAPTE